MRRIHPAAALAARWFAGAGGLYLAGTPPRRRRHSRGHPGTRRRHRRTQPGRRSREAGEEHAQAAAEPLQVNIGGRIAQVDPPRPDSPRRRSDRRTGRAPRRRQPGDRDREPLRLGRSRRTGRPSRRGQGPNSLQDLQGRTTRRGPRRRRHLQGRPGQEVEARSGQSSTSTTRSRPCAAPTFPRPTAAQGHRDLPTEETKPRISPPKPSAPCASSASRPCRAPSPLSPPASSWSSASRPSESTSPWRRHRRPSAAQVRRQGAPRRPRIPLAQISAKATNAKLRLDGDKAVVVAGDVGWVCSVDTSAGAGGRAAFWSRGQYGLPRPCR